MTLSELIERCEAAAADDDISGLIDEAYRLVNPVPRNGRTGGWLERYDPFERMLCAGAYIDAAMMLLPEGWNADAGFRPAKSLFWFRLARPEHDPLLVGDKYCGRSCVPALALVAASLRARSLVGEG